MAQAPTPVLTWLLRVALALALGLLALGQLGGLAGQPPADLGVRQGRLKPPSVTPNSVSSQAMLYPDHPRRETAQIAPLGRPGQARATLDLVAEVVAGMPGAQVVTRRPDYLYVQFTTRWLKFVDDVEFWADPVAQVVQVRSASRLGRSDFDLNRQRIEVVRRALGPQG